MADASDGKPNSNPGPVGGDGARNVDDGIGNIFGGGGSFSVNPAEAIDGRGTGSGGSGTGDASSGRGRRGRKPGSTNKKKAVDLGAVAGLIAMTHTLLAIKIAEMELDEKEAEQLAASINNVLRHYDVEASGKFIDHMALLLCIGSIYGTRGAAIVMRLRAEAETKKRNAPGNVYQMSPAS